MGAAALSACGPGETGPLESAWTEAEGETTCRMISAGWGAPMEAAAALMRGPHEPVEVDRLGGAPVFLFVHHCSGAENANEVTFAELYIHSEPEGELPADYRLKRASGQYLAFLAGDTEAAPLNVFAPHGVKAIEADVSWNAETTDAGETITATIEFPDGRVTVEQLFHANEDGDDFNTSYDAVSATENRLVRISGPEALARRKARRTSVSVEGSTPLDGLGLPQDYYMGALGEGVVRELTIKSAPALR